MTRPGNCLEALEPRRALGGFSLDAALSRRTLAGLASSGEAAEPGFLILAASSAWLTVDDVDAVRRMVGFMDDTMSCVRDLGTISTNELEPLLLELPGRNRPGPLGLTDGFKSPAGNFGLCCWALPRSEAFLLSDMVSLSSSSCCVVKRAMSCWRALPSAGAGRSSSPLTCRWKNALLLV